MYKQVDKMVPVSEIYKNELISKGVVTEDDIHKMQE
jgi:2-oxoglutarate dehydrogenase complex dehydrogenase (E1) component-like enzyme